MGQTVAEVTVALLAVIGFWCICRALTDWAFAPRQVVVAVSLPDGIDAATLDFWLSEAVRHEAHRRGAPVAILLGKGRSAERLSPEILAVAARYRAVFYTQADEI